MRKLLLLLPVFQVGCATIGAEHEGLARGLEQGVDHQEIKYMRLIDRFDKDARLRIDQKMRWIEGPEIIATAVERKDRKGKTFDDKVCEADGKLDRAHELLKFTRAASRSYERRKAKYVRKLEYFVRKLRAKSREEFATMRQAANSLTTSLGAYNKDKEWKKDMLRKLNVPVDTVDALNKSALEFDKMLEGE